MLLDRITSLLQSCDGNAPALPPTMLYNENWLLRLAIDWLATHRDEAAGCPIAPRPSATWFAEGWLPSAFLPRFRKDRLAESWTHADGVIGHFETGNRGWADVVLNPLAAQLVVVEGKMFSRLSAGVKNAPWYDQAARTVACMAEILRRADRHPIELDHLAYVLIAPRKRIDESVFADEMARGAILRKVRRRVEDYAGTRDEWFRDWFVPTIRQLDLVCLAWEELIETIAFHDPASGQEFDAFYNACLFFNRPQAVTMLHDLRSGPAPAPEPELEGLDDHAMIPARVGDNLPDLPSPRDPIREAAIRRKG
ncbi:hypothetical protein [Tautonia rosea]|uniref:hypothetical protein n=1 Tax=Tautonia rosea TaxID=2728037 RepID=UPI0014753829|nr:hypothetical protein [Tautonia rosea]